SNVQISEITSGCMCCTVSGEFSEAVTDILKSVTPDVLLIETTGIANPISVFMMLANDSRLILESILTVADAEHLLEQLSETLVTEIQLSICDAVILNKCDVASSDVIESAEARIRKHNSRAPIFRTSQSNIPPEVVMTFSNTAYKAELDSFVSSLKHHYDHEIERRLAQKRASTADFVPLASSSLFPIATSPDHHHSHHHGHDHSEAESYHLEVDEIETFVLEPTGIFEQRDFEQFLSDVPPECYRIKGVLNLKEYDHPVIFNFSSGRYTIDFESLAGEKQSETPNRLVFIGKGLKSFEEQITSIFK
ncbi:MAG: GTP-binding protein, partial [Chloroherpetonaceae bacterium]|nr:GTP-binding protein [Chloroherpetonaceae bacterium]